MFPAIAALFWVASLASPLIAQEEVGTTVGEADTTVVKAPKSKYGIFAGYLPDSPDAGPQLAVGLGRYMVNFGSRDGVKKGSIFEVHRYERRVGLVRVEQVWRDSATVRVVNLERWEHPPRSTNALPLWDGQPYTFWLFPHYVLLETVHFDLGKPVFTPQMHDRLRYAARCILSFPDFPVVIEGHTDNSGAAEKNLVLGRNRAEEIRRYLNEIQLVPMAQMHPVGFGETKPVTPNSSEDGRRQNRRVDIILMNEFKEK